MLKRQESSLSASRRQSATGTTPPPPETHHAKAIGCMSGIFQLFSKYQNPNKRLTSGKKQDKRKHSSPTSSINDSVPPKNSQSLIGSVKIESHNFDGNRLTCAIKVPRSPTLPPEIRRSNSPTSPGNSRTPPSSSLVARLMGLEDIGAAAKTLGFQEDPLTEKRQRLLQALEKCNEDLEALKRIIKAVQTPPPRDHPGDGNAGSLAAKPCIEKCTAEEPNVPVEEFTSSPLRSYSANSTLQNTGALWVPQQRKKPGEEDEVIAKLVGKSTLMESASVVTRREATVAPSWSSRAMVDSVEEVCKDICWGEKREIGRIGIVLQDHVCRDLIEELVKDLNSCSIIHPLPLPLPLDPCKRKLCF